MARNRSESGRQVGMPLHTSGRVPLAVLSADVAGYSRLMELHEEETHKRFMQLRSEVLDTGIASHHGRMVKSTGDGFLAAFEAAPDAVSCAVRLQEGVARHNASESAREPINFRMV
jgi:adenylate cyclase